MKTPLSLPNLEQHHPFRQWLQWEIPGASLTMEGYSRAGDKTFFHIPQLSVCLDAGLVEGRKGQHVFLTHCHNDHIADIEWLAWQQGTTVYVPREIAGLMDDYITARRRFVRGGSYDVALAVHETRALGAGETFEISHEKHHLQVRTVACEHVVSCLGYAFAEFRKRLVPELEQTKLRMIAEGRQAEFGQLMAGLRKEGKVVEEEYAHPLFAYMGDTHARIYEDQDWLWEYPFVITECTYIEGEHLDHADQRLHTHWEHLRPHVLAHPGTTFLLIHFSLRSSDAEVIAFFEAERERYGIDNVLLWCSGEPAMRQSGQRTG